MTICLEGLILLAGVAVLATLAVIFGCLGYGVSKIASYDNYRLIILIFAAPAAPILLLYVLVCLLIFSPTAYIIANNKGISAGETIGSCYRSMINNGKMTVFLSYFISGLIKLLYLGALGVGGYFLFTLYIPEKYFAIALIGYVIVSLIVYVLFAPILTLATRVVKEHLFEDIVLDIAALRTNEKVNLSVCNGKKLKAEATNRNLASLFEYAEDPYNILEKTGKKEQEFALDGVKVKSASKKPHKDDTDKPTKEEKSVEITVEEALDSHPRAEKEVPKSTETLVQPKAEEKEAPKSAETIKTAQPEAADKPGKQPETSDTEELSSQPATTNEN